MNKCTVELVGPFAPCHQLVVDGYGVPYITATPHTGKEDGLVSLLLDNRFGLTVPREELDRWAFFLLEAMAVSAGYSCYGENCFRLNPFQRRLSNLSLPETTP